MTLGKREQEKRGELTGSIIHPSYAQFLVSYPD